MASVPQRRAFVTPVFDASDPMVCHALALRPSLWTVFWFVLQELGQAHSWRQDDPLAATVQEVITEIRNAQDSMIFMGCMMIGQVIELSTNDIPDWCLICDGATYADADYPELGAVIHDGLRIDADNFRVPDRQSRFGMGGVFVGTQGGEDQHTLTIAEMPEHQHTYIESTIAASIVLGDQSGLENDDETPALTSAEGGGAPHNNMPPFEETQFVIIARYPTAG